MYSDKRDTISIFTGRGNGFLRIVQAVLHTVLKVVVKSMKAFRAHRGDKTIGDVILSAMVNKLKKIGNLRRFS